MSPAHHFQVRRMFDQADAVMSLLDQQVHRMSAEAFTATHQTGAVEVTVNGHRSLTGLSIHPGILGMGAHEVGQMINETISAASDYAEECITADVAEFADSIADALVVMRVACLAVGHREGEPQAQVNRTTLPGIRRSTRPRHSTSTGGTSRGSTLISAPLPLTRRCKWLPR